MLRVALPVPLLLLLLLLHLRFTEGGFGLSAGTIAGHRLRLRHRSE